MAFFTMTVQRAALLTSSSSLYSPHHLPCYCSLTKTTIRKNAAWKQLGASHLKSLDAKSPSFWSTNSSGAQPRARQVHHQFYLWKQCGSSCTCRCSCFTSMSQVNVIVSFFLRMYDASHRDRSLYPFLKVFTN